MANLSDTAIDIHKVNKVAVATGIPDQFVQLGDNSNLNQVYKVRFGEHLDFENQVDGTIKRKLEEPTDWKDSTNLPEKLADERSKLIEMLS